MQVPKLDFSGYNIYAGIDVHKKSWSVHIVGDSVEHGAFTQPPEPSLLVHYLRKNFPGAAYHCAYEAGFCGFWIHDQLRKEGVNCIVVNAADIPTTAKEKSQKRDKVDCKKIARALRSQQLRPIYVPSRDNLEDRMLVRNRFKLVENRTRCKNRIKATLCYYGINIPPELDSGKWSKKLTGWLKALPMSNASGKTALDILIKELEALEALIKELTIRIQVLSQTDTYKRNMELLRSIPGIGGIAAITLLTELGDINRFKTLDRLNSFIGLVPCVYASGDTEKLGHMTYRGHDVLKCLLVEASWMAVRRDPALMLQYQVLTKRMKGNKAIIRIVRKLINRVRYVLKNQKPYELGVVA